VYAYHFALLDDFAVFCLATQAAYMLTYSVLFAFFDGAPSKLTNSHTKLNIQ
jgi:hypothetical protein